MSENNNFNEEYDERGRLKRKAWYAFATTSKYEKRVREGLNNLAQNNYWKDKIFRVVLPSKIELDAKGKEKEVLTYTQTGYIEMVYTDETFHEIRITGFRTLLPAGEPVALQEHEIKKILDDIGEPYDDDAHLEDLMQAEYVRIIKKGHPDYGKTAKLIKLSTPWREVSLEFGEERHSKTLKLKTNEVEVVKE